MSDILEVVEKLRRPRLLLRAARLGMVDYDRARELRSLIPMAPIPSPEKALKILLETECALEMDRKEGNASYSVMRHVRVMIALLAETRLARRNAQELR